MIRCSIQIAGNRLTDNEFTNVYIKQEVGQHNEVEIRLRQDAMPDVLLEKIKNWIGEKIIIGIESKDDDDIIIGLAKDFFKGIVTSLALARRSGTAELVVKGAGPTITMDDGANTQSFTDMSLQEIVDKVMKPYNSYFPNSPTVSPQLFSDSIPYCVQYKESNFNFINRLSGRYGEWFYYDGLDLYFGKGQSPAPIKLNFGEGGLDYFDLSVNTMPGKFELKGYDYLKHEVLTEEAPEKTKLSKAGQEAMDAAQAKMYQEKPLVAIQTSVDKAELKNLAERREQINLDDLVKLIGGSSNAGLKLGSTIEIEDKLIGEQYGCFVITSIIHNIDQTGGYNNSFEAIPEEMIVYPLAALPLPPYCEMQLAKVKEVNDEKKLGRVKVEFIWQEGSGETSPWLRVASPYTGKDKGFYIIPEVGDQVLVAFENNNPEKPYVLSGMYNGDAKPEWFDGKNKFKGFKSKGKNEWKFDDDSGSITVKAPKDINLFAGTKINFATTGAKKGSITMDGDALTINAKTITITATDSITIDGKSTAVLKSMDLTLTGSSKTTINNTNIEIKGKQVSIDGSGGVTVTGATVKLNS